MDSAAKLAEAELNLQLLSARLDTAADDRRRVEAARDQAFKERDSYLSELRTVESEAKVLGATSDQHSASAQQHHARLLAELTELRRRLSAVESAREKERAQLSNAQAQCMHLQVRSPRYCLLGLLYASTGRIHWSLLLGRISFVWPLPRAALSHGVSLRRACAACTCLQGMLNQHRLHAQELKDLEQRREINERQQQAIAQQQRHEREELDHTLAFNAEILAFAKGFGLDPAETAGRRTRDGSPLRTPR